MNSNKTRFALAALAALLAVLAVPALADSPADCTPCSDPFFPKLENPAPPLAINGKGKVFEAQLWAENIQVVTPAVALKAQPADTSPAPEPRVDEAPTARYAVEFSAPEQLATHR